jgi:lipopolysaccharide/colanic/teichoic acid biosynthesis glycosyltransferase
VSGRDIACERDPNALGSFLLLGMGLAFGLAWSAPRGWAGRRRHLGATITLVLATLALGATVSRAAWLSALLAALWLTAFSPERLFRDARRAAIVRRTSRRIAVAVCVFVAVWGGARVLVTAEAPVAPTDPVGVVMQSLDPRTPLRTVSKERSVMWSAAADLFVDHPIVGAGLGRFPAFYTTVPGATSAENAHNFYLQILAETGVVGFAAFAVLALTIVRAFWLGVPARTPRLGRLGYGLAGGLIAFSLSAVTGHPLLTVSNQVWLSAVLAIGLGLLYPPRAGQRPVTRPLPTRRSQLSLGLKRAVDVVVAAALLVVLAPVMALIALAVRTFSQGPVLFRQQRVARQKDTHDVRVFPLVKFRTMYPDVDPYAQSPVSPDDPRITPIGRFLRRTCLDELPQLWNVLSGDMSLVGPRPEMPWIVESYDAQSRVRLEAQPGLTGLWQLRGRRDRMIHRDLRWDVLYVHRRGLGLDVIILLETLRFVARGRNH